MDEYNGDPFALEAPVLTVVREIGFNNTYGLGKPQEQLFFVGYPGRSGKATKEALLGAIRRWSHWIDVTTEYLENDMNNNTQEWKK